jgi:hypothetical protein
VTEYVHDATVHLAERADPRAVGGAITVALCGTWDHEPPCRWPHHTDIAAAGDGHVVRTSFVAEPRDEPVVREKIAAALESGEQAGPDGQVSRWTLKSGAEVPGSAGHWPG